MAKRNGPLSNEELVSALTGILGSDSAKALKSCEYETKKHVTLYGQDAQTTIPYPESEKLIADILLAVGEYHPGIYKLRLWKDPDGYVRMESSIYLSGCE